MKCKIVIFLVFISVLAVAQTNKMSTEQYIFKYKDYAIAEMYRAGVPASITLAQGILESQNGNSRLAKEANNHFGIKCKTGWVGKTIIADDDAVGECFRAYESALESFEDHSNFLRDNWRYNECFNLARTDYTAWAEGLRKAGYATNPKYNTLLTGLVDRYKLHEFDLAPMPQGITPGIDLKINNIPMVLAKEGETIESIAQKNEINSKKIYRYNDLTKEATIEPGDIVFLKPKHRKASEPYYTVKEGDDLYTISQLYGIKLKQLYKKNHLSDDEEALPGSKLYLQKKSDEKPATMSKEEFERLEKDKKIREEIDSEIAMAKASEAATIKANETAVLKAKETAMLKAKEEEKAKKKRLALEAAKKAESDSLLALKTEIIEGNEMVNSNFHIVKNGDNLYRISEKYHVLVEDILDWNGIASPDGISLGDKIYLTKEEALKAGKIKTPQPKTNIAKSKTHLVSRGDTAYKICKTYGIKPAQLMEWNNLKNLDNIQEGQKLKVAQ